MANTLSKLTTAGNLYTRGTLDEATFNPNQNSYRKNLAAYSQDGSQWTRTLGGLKIISTNELAPDGTYTAVRVRPTATFSNIQTQNACWLPNISLIGSIWVRVDAGTRILSFGLNGGGLTTNFTATSNWQRFSTISYLNRVTYNDYFNIYDPNVSGFVDYIIWGWQVEQSTTATIYEQTGANAIPSSNALSKLDSVGNYYTKGTIDEVTFNPTSTYRKNLLSYSQNSSLSPWFNLNTNVITSITDPSNQLNAFKLVENTTSNSHGISQSGILKPAKAVLTLSIYAKAAERTGLGLVINDNVGGFINRYGAEFDLIAGTASNHDGAQSLYTNGSFSISSVGNGWYRCSITCTTGFESSVQIRIFSLIPITTWTSVPNYQGNGVSGIYLYGPQVETGSQSTIYEQTGANAIPTSNNLSKLDTAGNHYLLGSYDEFTKGANLVSNGLIYYMDPSKSESWNGNTTIYDITKTQTPGSLVGSYRYNNESGGTITLDGNSGYANTGIVGNTSQFQSTSEFTMSIWCKFTESSKYSTYGTGTIFGSFNYGGFGITWSTAYPGGGSKVEQVYAGIRTNTASLWATYPSTIQLNVWYNFVLVYSGPNKLNLNRLYTNGTLSASSTTTSEAYSTNMNGQYINIGALNPSGGAYVSSFPGFIGQALIYNRALSATEITQNFNEMQSQYGV